MTETENLSSSTGSPAQPRVSVLMPVYNAERYVGQTIDSILSQTFTDFEFIAIDDGSTDDSLAVVQRYAARDARLRVVTRPNQGIVATLNESIELARGTYLARIDSDDASDPRRFALQVARLDAEPDLMCLGSNSIVTDPDGRPIGSYPVPLDHITIDAAHLAGASSIHHPAVMMRADAVRRVGGYRQGFCPAEDLDLWIRLAEVGQVANLPEPLLIRRLTLDGLVATKEHLQQQTVQRILTDAWVRRSLPGQPPTIQRNAITLAERYRQWAWLAIKGGHRNTARRYAGLAVRHEPFHKASWNVLSCALRGR